eukprot:Mrub_06054.p1 GENE.Mrub_06054~~Mrub_06054.p1  ORF type:complete len:200 (-),score=36.74 Mrub_06054:371-970(-)
MYLKDDILLNLICKFEILNDVELNREFIQNNLDEFNHCSNYVDLIITLSVFNLRYIVNPDPSNYINILEQPLQVDTIIQPYIAHEYTFSSPKLLQVLEHKDISRAEWKYKGNSTYIPMDDEDTMLNELQYETDFLNSNSIMQLVCTDGYQAFKLVELERVEAFEQQLARGTFVKLINTIEIYNDVLYVRDYNVILMVGD